MAFVIIREIRVRLNIRKLHFLLKTNKSIGCFLLSKIKFPRKEPIFVVIYFCIFFSLLRNYSYFCIGIKKW